MQALPHSVLPTLQQPTSGPCLCQSLLDTQGQDWVSHLWGHFSFFLGPGVHKFLCLLDPEPDSAAGHSWPVPPQETLKHSKAGLLQSLGSSDVLKVVFDPSKHLWQLWGLILNAISPLLLSCWGFSFALEHGVSFSGGIQHSSVDGCFTASCNFGVLTGEDECTSFYSAIFIITLQVIW